MPFIVIKQAADLKALGALLLKQPAGGKRAKRELGPATLEQLKTLNPHVDFQQVEAGTVLLLPDLPELHGAAERFAGGASFEDFANEVDAGMRAVGERIRAGVEAMAADQAALQEALAAPPIQRLIASDRLLASQLEATRKTFELEQEQARDAAQQIETMRAELAQELTALGRMSQ